MISVRRFDFERRNARTRQRKRVWSHVRCVIGRSGIAREPHVEGTCAQQLAARQNQEIPWGVFEDDRVQVQAILNKYNYLIYYTVNATKIFYLFKFKIGDKIDSLLLLAMTDKNIYKERYQIPLECVVYICVIISRMNNIKYIQEKIERD